MKLQEARKSKGLSQKQLAELSGVPLRTIQAYESGAKDIAKASLETVAKLARALGCNVAVVDKEEK